MIHKLNVICVKPSSMKKMSFLIVRIVSRIIINSAVRVKLIINYNKTSNPKNTKNQNTCQTYLEK